MNTLPALPAPRKVAVNRIMFIGRLEVDGTDLGKVDALFEHDTFKLINITMKGKVIPHSRLMSMGDHIVLNLNHILKSGPFAD